MFILRSTKDEEVHYIRKNITKIGRQGGDIILNDNGVSRNHAELLIEDSKLYIKNLKDQLRTSINNTPVTNKNRSSLQVGDVVRFGLAFEFRIEKLSFRVCTSSLSEVLKTELEEHLRRLDTKLSRSFRPDCTHLVVQELCPSVKVICAVILNIPLVTVDFFKELCDVSKGMPNEGDFRPVIKPSVHEVKESYFRFSGDRKTLFRNKTFVFVDEKSGKSMRTMIALAGGEYSSFDPSLICEYRRTSIPAKYIIIHCSALETLRANKNVKTAYSEVCAALTACQWRTIPMQEIAFALLKCNCDIDCNPAFNKGNKLLCLQFCQDRINTQTPLAQSTQLSDRILASESETHATLHEDANITDIIIPPTCDTQLDDFMNIRSTTPTAHALARRNRTATNKSNYKTAEKRCDSTPELSSNPIWDDIDTTNTQNSVHSSFLIPTLPPTASVYTNDSVLTLVRRKSGPRSDATLENPIRKKVARADVVLSNFKRANDENNSQWICKLTPSQNKRKFDEVDVSSKLSDDDSDDDILAPIKSKPFCEPLTKRPNTVVPAPGNDLDSPISDDIHESDEKEFQTLTQVLTTYFEAYIKNEDISDAAATVADRWLSGGSDEHRLEAEDKAGHELLVEEYEKKYFCRLRGKFRDLNLGDDGNHGPINYKKFRKTQHVKIISKGILNTEGIII